MNNNFKKSRNKLINTILTVLFVAILVYYKDDIDLDKITKLYKNTSVKKDIQLNKISPIITVNKDTRMKYWDKFQNYSIDISYLTNYNILRFQKYDTKFPFNEIKSSYEVNTSDLKNHVFKLNPSTNYVLISHNNIKKISMPF